MYITLAIPKDRKNINRFILNELGQSKNIKSKETRVSIETGLNKILNNLETGKVYLWNSKTLTIIDYNLTDFIYHCGTEFVVPKVNLNNKYLLVVIDDKEATIGQLYGKKITRLWYDTSGIIGKHRNGGQSAQRYERLREEGTKQWYRKVSQKLKDIIYQNDKNNN